MTTTLDPTGLKAAIRRARNAGVPLVSIDTADQPYTCTAVDKAIAEIATDQKREIPASIMWDQVRGLTPLNVAGEKWLTSLSVPAGLPKPGQPPTPPFSLAKTVDFATALDVACAGTKADHSNAFPEDGVYFAFNAHRVLEGDGPRAATGVQAVMNARELFKERGATFITLSPGLRLPTELGHDVMTLREALPNEGRVEQVVRECYVQAGLADPKTETGFPDQKEMARIVDASLGLSTFAIEQSVASSLSKGGANVDMIWDRKISLIEQTEGLSVYRGKDRFDRLHGAEGAQEFVQDLAEHWNPRVVLWWDEVEKAIAGYKGDNTGVSQDAMGTILNWTDGGQLEGREVVGLLLMGGPGTGKSQFAKCCGTLLGCPTVKFDTGAMQSAEVGSSQRKIRTGLNVVDAVGQGRVLLVATCNGIDLLPAELRRRFRYGLYYFDLPTEAAHAAIWKTWRVVYNIPEADVTPNHFAWTGAEIKACCEIAARTKRPLAWAARKIVSVYRSNPGLVEGLRKQAAEGGFIDARTGEEYILPKNAKPELATALPGAATRGRKISMES